MQAKFNSNWNKSKQPRRQRKYLANAPNHLRHKLMCSNLDKPLREKYGIRSIEVRKNDEVLVMRGKYSTKKAKVSVADLKYGKVQLDGVNLSKKDGESATLWFYPSNLKILKLEDSDSRRFKNLKKKNVKAEVVKEKAKEIKSKDASKGKSEEK